MDFSNSETASAKTHKEASTEMVCISAGEFQMGSRKRAAAAPVHTVYLDEFYIDIYEVTNAQFKVFIDANPHWRKDKIPSEYHNGSYLKLWNGDHYPHGKANHPVVYVSWYAAMAYAQWVGKRLPTEAEWEKAARGGAVGKRYVWGDSPDPSKANYINNGNPEYTAPVGSYQPNGYGLYDMGGNVWELCMDEYDTKFYSRSPAKNPIAGASSLEMLLENFMDVRTARVARGGSWATPGPAHTADRGNDLPTNTNGWLGFRCAKTLTTQEKAELSKLRSSARQPSEVAFDSEKSFQQVAENNRNGVAYIEAISSTILTLPWRIRKLFTRRHSATYTNLHRFLSRIQDEMPIGIAGTGFFIARDLLVTNIHVVAHAKTVAAKQLDSEEPVLYTIEGVMAFDAKNDLVVLKVAEECDTSLRLGDSENVQDRENVCIVTYAEAKFTYMKGTIFSEGASDKFYRVKAGLTPGNSGSPILNSRGEVVGIAAAAEVIKATGASEFAHAAPSNVLSSLLKKRDDIEPFDAWRKRPCIRAYVVSSHGDKRLKKEKYRTALAKYDVALNHNPDLLRTYINRGTAKLGLNDYEGAIADCDAALQRNPDVVFGYTNRVVAKMAIYDIEGVLEDMDFAFQHFRDSVDFQLYLVRASAKSYLGDMSGAIEDVGESIKLKPDFAEAYAIRGMIKSEQEDYQAAIGNAAKAIHLKPKSEIGYASRSGAKRLLGKFNNTRGNIAKAEKLYQEALEDAEKAVRLKPKSYFSISTQGHAKQSLGESKAAKGDIAGARELYKAAIADHTKAIQIKPKSPIAYNGRGWANYLLGQLETGQGKTARARKRYQATIVDSSEAIRIVKNFYSAYSYFHTRGAAKAALGDYDEAIADFSEAIRLKPVYATAYRDRAKAKQALGQNETAEADYEKAKTLEAAAEKKMS